MKCDFKLSLFVRSRAAAKDVTVWRNNQMIFERLEIKWSRVSLSR